MADYQSEIQKLQAENKELKALLKKSRQMELQCIEKMRILEQKEGFHYALFNYNPVNTVVVDRAGRVVKSNAAKRRTKDRLPNIGDIMYCDYASRHSIDMYRQLMECIQNDEIREFKEVQYGSKFLSITISPFPEGAIITSQDVTERVRAQKDRIKLINELQRALNEVETLRGLLPICASCKSIRDDKGYWSTIEEYFSCRSSVDFSHTLCPECLQMLYPDIYEKMKAKEVDPHKTR
ncbi:MAG: hypothetical protein ACOC41_04045 [Chitinivibrionales bacterium]